jgi:hypothetical protein
MARNTLLKTPYIQILAIRKVSKYLTTRFISKKIDEALDTAKNKMADFYAEYLKNVFFYTALNAVTILLTLIPYSFFSINEVIIIIVSLISVFMITRFVFLTIRNIIRIKPYIKDIVIFLIGLMDYKSLPIATKEYIRYKFQMLYFENTNGVGRFSHSVFSGLGFVKSSGQIEDEVVDEFYRLIKYYLIKNIIYKIAALAAFYAVFFLLLKPLIFSYTLHMNIFQVVFYPFTVALPKVIDIIRGSI